MGLLDNIKDAVGGDDAEGLVGKAKDLANEHADKIDGGIDQVAGAIDEKTGGKFGDQIQQGADFLKDKTGEL